MSTIRLDNSLTIRTFPPPPEGSTFDPLTASAADLAIHGFPPRPENPELLLRFERHFKRVKGRLRCIEPTFSFHPRAKSGQGSRPEVVEGGDTKTWSGAVVYAPSGDSFKWVQAEWVVPNATKSVGSNASVTAAGIGFNCSAWVGIGDSSLLQAGVGINFNQDGVPEFSLWHEWVPGSGGSTSLKNFPVNAGDLITVVICTPSGAGSTSGTIYFSNNTQRTQTSYNISINVGPNVPPSLIGDQAEWIVERPYVAGGAANLPNYGEVFFSNATAGLASGAVVNAGTTGGNNGSIDMVVNGVTLSNGVIHSPTVVQCLYAGDSDETI